MNAPFRIHTATALPDASAWHQSPKVQAIIAEMVELTAMRQRLLRAGLTESEVHDLGYLEWGGDIGRSKGWQAFGYVAQLVCHLDSARDEAAEDARLTAANERGWHINGDDADDYAAQVEAHLDTVDAAISGRVDHV